MIVTSNAEVTGDVVTGNVALDEPAGTVTDVGTVTEGSELARPTTKFWAAGPVRVTVPVTVDPPTVLEGSVTLLSTAGFTVIEPLNVFTPSVADIVDWTGEVTGVVLIGNVVKVAPAGTVTVDGTLAALAELARDTGKFEGAAAMRSTSLLLTVEPPVAELACRINQESVTGFNVRTALAVLPP